MSTLVPKVIAKVPHIVHMVAISATLYGLDKAGDLYFLTTSKDHRTYWRRIKVVPESEITE